MSLRGLEGFKYEAMQVEVKRRGHLGRLRVGSLLARRMMMLPKDHLTDSANPTGRERERDRESETCKDRFQAPKPGQTRKLT